MSESESDLPGRAKVLLRAMRNPTAFWSCFSERKAGPHGLYDGCGGFYLERVPNVGPVTIEALLRGGFIECCPRDNSREARVYRLRDFWWLDQTWWRAEDFGDLWIG